MTEPHGSPRGERGATSVEYVLVTALAVFVLFVPVDGDGRSALELLLDALRGFQQNTTYLLSLP